MDRLYHRHTGLGAVTALLEGSDEDALVALAGKPLLLDLPGTAPAAGRAARFVACLLHGNEDSGFRAVLELLRSGRRFPYDLWVFIGNTRAARQEGWFANRYLPDQEDFNRVWGLAHPTTRMRRCADQVLAELQSTRLEGALDLHNNTGDSPPYAVLPVPTPQGLHLAAVCADTAFLWGLRANTLMEALSPVCPAIAMECGLAGLPAGTAIARDALERFLVADLEPSEAALRRPEHLFEMRARVTVRAEVPYTFGGVLSDEVDLVIAPGLDAANFGMLLAGTTFGRVHPGAAMPLSARSMRGEEEVERWFTVRPDGALVTTSDVTLAMMVTTVVQARRDCLCYVARRRT